MFPLYIWKNSAETHLTDLVVCVFSVALCLLCSLAEAEPLNSPVICSEQTIICLSEKRLFSYFCIQHWDHILVIQPDNYQVFGWLLFSQAK